MWYLSTCESNPGEFTILVLVFVCESVTKTTGLGLLAGNTHGPLPSETAQFDCSTNIIQHDANTGSKSNLRRFLVGFLFLFLWAA